MANVKISELMPATTPLAGTEATPIVQGGVTVRAPASAFGPVLPLTVANGGTGIGSGTSGGVPYFSAAGTISASGVLTLNRIVLGGGAGAAPTVLGSLGTSTTVLHGNAGGAPTFGAVSLTADVSGTLPIANGGTGQTSANPALNALLPNQSGQSANVLTSDGTDASWQAAGGGSALPYKVAFGSFDDTGAPVGVPQGIDSAIPQETEGLFEINYEDDYFFTVDAIVANTFGNSSTASVLITSLGDDATSSLIQTIDGAGTGHFSSFSIVVFGAPLPTTDVAPVLDELEIADPNIILSWSKAFFVAEAVGRYDIYRIDAQTLQGQVNFAPNPTIGDLVLYSDVDSDTFSFEDTEPPAYLTTQYAYYVRAVGADIGELNSEIQLSPSVS